MKETHKVKMNFGTCPYCGASNENDDDVILYETIVHESGSEVYFPAHCTECESDFKEVYSLEPKHIEYEQNEKTPVDVFDECIEDIMIQASHDVCGKLSEKFVNKLVQVVDKDGGDKIFRVAEIGFVTPSLDLAHFHDSNANEYEIDLHSDTIIILD